MTKRVAPARKRYDNDPAINQLERILRDYEALINTGVQNGSKEIGSEPSCRGCKSPGCCHQLTPLTLAESFPLARRIIQDGKDTIPFRRRLFKIGVEQELVGRERWWKTATACPLLTASNRCSVYEQRPIMCRAYYSWSDRKLCMPPNEETVKTIDMPAVKRTLMLMNVDFSRSLGLSEKRFFIASMPRMLAVVLTALRLETREGLKFLESQDFPTFEQVPTWFTGGAILQKNSESEEPLERGECS